MGSLSLKTPFINPRRMRVSIVALCMSVCLSVCLLFHISPVEHLFVLKMLSHTQQAKKVKRISAAFVSYGVKHEQESKYVN